MIDDELQRAWLETHASTPELTIPFFIGPRIPEFGNADLFGVVTPVSGPGATLEGVNTVVGFQVRMVARLNSYGQLKSACWQLHQQLMFADVPADLWGTRVVWVSTAGGDPVPDNPDGVDLDRVQFVCTYLAEVGL